jgi:GTP-binding protein YchF
VLREGAIDPIGDIEVIELELAMADLETLRRAADRVAKKGRAGDKDALFEADTFTLAIEKLDAGQQLREVDWNERQRKALKPLFLMTMKPVLYVANVGDDDLAGDNGWCRAVAAHAAGQGAQWLPICGDLELELRSMDVEDRAMFMEELGVAELGLERLIRTVYELLGLRTYFTAGEKEVRAWTIHAGDCAPRAAGVIHTDFEKAFIRAEVYSVADLEEYGSEAAIRAAGKLRTEGRDYVMKDGDIAHFLIGK